MRNFSIGADGISITAGTSSAATLIDSDTNPDPDVMIYNPGPYTVYVKAGGSGVVATTNSMPILAGEKGAFNKGGNLYLATLSPSGSQQIVAFAGEGW
jgi:hypothetical protein